MLHSLSHVRLQDCITFCWPPNEDCWMRGQVPVSQNRDFPQALLTRPPANEWKEDAVLPRMREDLYGCRRPDRRGRYQCWSGLGMSAGKLDMYACAVVVELRAFRRV